MFTGNTALYGGAIFARTINATTSTFANNQAITYNGGAIDADTIADLVDGNINDGSTATVRSSIFTGNSAVGYGGAIRAVYANVSTSVVTGNAGLDDSIVRVGGGGSSVNALDSLVQGASPRYTLAVTVVGTGSVSDGIAFTCSTGTCTQSFVNTDVTLSPASGTLTAWSGDGANTPDRLFTKPISAISGAYTVARLGGTIFVDPATSYAATATFTAPRAVTVTIAGTGTGTVTDGAEGNLSCTKANTPCINSYADGTTVTLSASAGVGSVFTGWSGADGCTGTSTCVFASIHAAKAATATFMTSGGTSCGTLPVAVCPTIAAGGGNLLIGAPGTGYTAKTIRASWLRCSSSGDARAGRPSSCSVIRVVTVATARLSRTPYTISSKDRRSGFIRFSVQVGKAVYTSAAWSLTGGR
jgi:hypothetical protein